jgi:hypothetical protein
MSYFVTITGPNFDVGGIGSVELIPAMSAQSYVCALEAKFIVQDGNRPVFLVHDGDTGTSHDLVGAAMDAIIDGAEFFATDLGKVLSRIVAPSIVRMWDAGADDPIGDMPFEADGLESLSDAFVSMTRKGDVKYVRSQLTSRSSGPVASVAAPRSQ